VQHAGEQLEERALARAVGPDDAERLARAHREAHVAQRPERRRVAARARRRRPRLGAAGEAPGERRQEVAEAVVRGAAGECLPHADEFAPRLGAPRGPAAHTRSANSGSRRAYSSPDAAARAAAHAAEYARCHGDQSTAPSARTMARESGWPATAARRSP